MSRHRDPAARAGWRAPALAATAGALVVLLAVAVVLVVRGGSSASHVAARSAQPTTASPPPPAPTPTPSSTHVVATRAAKPVLPTSSPSRTRAAGTTRSASLPLADSTGNATQALTVIAPSTSSTTGTLQAWQKQGGGWVRYGSSMSADLGSDGLSAHPSESISATPIGSFTLTQAFGADPDPGTDLPYLQTQSDDWWISQSGPLYNTHQRCASNCGFVQGSPNEHLRYETPAYDYAVVIDYNTANAGPIVQGAGSAFFLHVSDGTSTAGCVSIPQDRLVTIMRWLRTGDHPRILIGVGGGNG